MRQKTISAIVYIFAALHSMLACWVFIRDNGADYYNWDFDIVKAYVNPSDEYLFQFAVINIVLSIILAITMFLLIGKNLKSDIGLAIFAWVFNFIVYYLTTGFYQLYLWAAVFVTYAVFETFNKAKQAGTS